MRKLLEIIKKRKKFFIVIAIFLVVVIIFQARKPQTGPAITPIQRSTATPGQSFGPLEFLEKVPQGETITSLWSVEPVTFVFNQPIKPDSVKFTIDPNVEAKIKYSTKTPSQFSVVPLDGWEANVKYAITITEAEGVYGSKLAKPINTFITRLFDPTKVTDIPDEH